MICLFNGRPGIVDEIFSAAVVCNGIRTKFSRYVKDADLEDAVLGFVQTESCPEERFRAIMSAFRRLADNNTDVRCYAYQLATQRLSEMLWKMQQVLFLSADRRLAIFLLEETEKNGGDEVHLTHEQIARYMGTAREVVSRLVKYFNQEGWIKNSRGCITIIQRDSLQELAGNQVDM